MKPLLRRHRRRLLASALLSALILSSGGGALAVAQRAGVSEPLRLGDLVIPSPRGYVNDFAGVLQPRDRQVLEAYLRNLNSATGAQFALVTIPSLEGEERDDVTVRLFEAWKLGAEGDDRGLLILDAIEDRQMRVEVGYGLEGILPDGLVGQLMDEAIARFIRDRTSLTPQDRLQAYGFMIQSMAQIVARDAGVPAEDLVPRQMPEERQVRRRRNPLGLLPLIIMVIVFLAIFRRNPLLALLLLLGMSGGGRGRYHGGFGGGFGGFGGGFGGFGGGASGGGGAGRGY
jgi:uncharacterized protein